MSCFQSPLSVALPKKTQFPSQSVINLDNVAPTHLEQVQSSGARGEAACYPESMGGLEGF